jgi:hypothetical protein
MKAQQLHHKHVPHAFLNSVASKDFAPMHLTAKALSDDSCWDEYESEYEESLPSYALTFFNESVYE